MDFLLFFLFVLLAILVASIVHYVDIKLTVAQKKTVSIDCVPSVESVVFHEQNTS